MGREAALAGEGQASLRQTGFGVLHGGRRAAAEAEPVPRSARPAHLLLGRQPRGSESRPAYGIQKRKADEEKGTTS